MKPRRFRSSVDLLPTITELQENASHVHHTQSLDDYMGSYPLIGPLQGSRLPTPRMAKYPTLASSASPNRGRAWAPIGPDNISLSLVLQTDSRAPVCPNQDPLDWLFTQAQNGGLPLTESVPGSVCMV